MKPVEVSIVGCGYTGRRLAERWSRAGARVRGFAVRAESLRSIEESGAEAQPLDLDSPIAALDFEGHLIYYAVPPARRTGDPRLERFLACIKGIPSRLVYLSTTGVYGDQSGARVDEDTPTAPRTERAERRVAAETVARSWTEQRGVSWCVLRVAGIYGPGRLPLDRLLRAVPAIVPQEATPTNRIHVTDLVTVCVAAGSAAAADRRIYNVSDGSEHSSTDYLQQVAALARLPPPPLISRAEAQRTATASSWSFLAESRRVDNSRMLRELEVRLEYRELDQGIRASLLENGHAAGLSGGIEIHAPANAASAAADPSATCSHSDWP
jgi:nucleoside-diphosphate-sugar epimerase